MQLSSAPQEWMKGLGSREHALTIARIHLDSEHFNDPELVCKTISEDVFFAVPDKLLNGFRFGDEEMVTTKDEVRRYYEDRISKVDILSTYVLREVASDWYAFFEVVNSLRGKGGADAATVGLEYNTHTAVLFPTAPDGIRGEIAIRRYPRSVMVEGTVDEPSRTSLAKLPTDVRATDLLPLDDLEQAIRLDGILTALSDHREEDLRAQFSSTHCLGVRLDGELGGRAFHSRAGLDGVADLFKSMSDGAEEFAVATRVASPWFLFAEYAFLLSGGPVRRVALLHAIEHREIIGTFGYGAMFVPE